MSCTISEILTLSQCPLLPVTSRSPAVSIRQLKWNATDAVWFMCKHIVWTIHVIFSRERKLDGFQQLKWPSMSLITYCTCSVVFTCLSVCLSVCLYSRELCKNGWAVRVYDTERLPLCTTRWEWRGSVCGSWNLLLLLKLHWFDLLWICCTTCRTKNTQQNKAVETDICKVFFKFLSYFLIFQKKNYFMFMLFVTCIRV